MRIEMSSMVLSQGSPHAELAWADLRGPATGIRGLLFDCLRLSSPDSDMDLIGPMLRYSPVVGLPSRFQCRIDHRPQPASRYRLVKGLFGEIGRAAGAKHEQLEIAPKEFVICGVWPLDAVSTQFVSDGCADHSICCFVVSSRQTKANEVLNLLKMSVVLRGVCSINYPHLAELICSSGDFILRVDPRDRRSVILLGPQGSEEFLRLWASKAF